MIDCHAHFFDPGRPEGLAWPSPSAAFYGRKLMEEYRLDFGESGPSVTLAIEASRRAVDDLWLAQFARQEASILGYIANLQPDQPGFQARLETHVANPKFKGLRLRPIEVFALDGDRTHRICEALEVHGKVLELGAKTSDRLPDIFGLAQSHPNLNMILDHAGHPDLSAAEGDKVWESHLSSSALPQNLWWKLTPNLGSPCEPSAPANQALANCLVTIATYVEKGKILLGSNWPVSHAGAWSEFHDAVSRCIPPLAEGEGTLDAAEEAYRIP